MKHLDRATVIPKDSTDLNQLVSLMTQHTWLKHIDADYNPNFEVGKQAYVFFNVDRLHKGWSSTPIKGDTCISVNELASQLAYWAGQPRYNP